METFLKFGYEGNHMSPKRGATSPTARGMTKPDFKNAMKNSRIKLNDVTKEQLILYTKLFVIMGLSWMTECIPFLFHNHRGNETNHDGDCHTEVSYGHKIMEPFNDYVLILKCDIIQMNTSLYFNILGLH